MTEFKPGDKVVWWGAGPEWSEYPPPGAVGTVEPPCQFTGKDETIVNFPLDGQDYFVYVKTVDLDPAPAPQICDRKAFKTDSRTDKIELVRGINPDLVGLDFVGENGPEFLTNLTKKQAKKLGVALIQASE